MAKIGRTGREFGSSQQQLSLTFEEFAESKGIVRSCPMRVFHLTLLAPDAEKPLSRHRTIYVADMRMLLQPRTRFLARFPETPIYATKLQSSRELALC